MFYEITDIISCVLCFSIGIISLSNFMSSQTTMEGKMEGKKAYDIIRKQSRFQIECEAG